MKRRKLTFTIASVLSISFLAVVGGYVAKSYESTSYKVIEKASATSTSNAAVGGGLAGAGNYYDGISDSLTGDDLLNALHTLNSQKRTRTVGYAGFRQFAATCDADPDGSGKIIGFYDNAKIGPSWDSGSTWNREHVWPNVRDGDKVENDAHMVRPAATSTNSDRGSKGFGTDSYDPGKDVAYYRGAAARIIFYAAIADTSLKVVDYSFPYNGVQNGNHGYDVGTMGSLSDMLQWNLQYLPSDTSFTGANDLARRTELSRNEKIQTASNGQGNRNPFIDHPEYACKIWGNTNAKTKQICGSAPVTSTVTLDKGSATLEVGQTVTLAATSSNGGTITWERGNANLVTISSTTSASGSSITVTAIAPGSTTITAKNSDNASASATITINAQTQPLKLNHTTLDLAVGEKAELIATTNDGTSVTFGFEDVAYKILGFGSSKAESGQPLKLTGLKDGTTTITVTAGNGATATCVVKVGTGVYKEDKNNKNKGAPNIPLIVGLSVGGGGGLILVAGLVVLIVLIVKKRKAA